MRRFVARFCFVVLIVAGSAALYEYLTWPNVSALARDYPKSTAFIDRYRAERRRAGLSDSIRYIPVRSSRIAPALKQAVLVAEDINFFGHKGFAVEEIKKAVAEAWHDKEMPRGASTITQQLAKNLWLSPSRNPLRKAKEALLTRQLEQQLGKKRILELYLNVVEFGPGVFGAEAAAQQFFGESAADLSAADAATLAAGLPKPKSWHPGSKDPIYRRRVEIISSRMVRAEWLFPLL